ncbi:hypothetical protein A3D70_01585 [Candidatus Adlerbacteria bacterium RIFCSPHIGHO2_02_FULL_54_18]|uniref:Uncharacterized protein n=1 Tax=Candidatus Adlerbacteria bacterium RIFCSPHIGHO2_02_FULL_54_18 TaxID=1797241 RepID=A0A1F4Y517_9BACT|nr:MAG: hypothetical protein A3D70_01585 [Candidatus Adlerbacteria bacterium RIFCSPHIGHO2_02_FULL_54_18]
MAWGEVLYITIYVLQQLGMMLGVGSITVLLCAHLVALHRGERDSPQMSYVHAAHTALSAAFFLIILSGLAAVVYHYLGGALGTLLQPTFLFKWVLIFVLLLAHLVQGRMQTWNIVVYGFAGGTWYALFLVHSVAPVASWETLGILYGLWIAFFGLVWTGFLLLLRGGLHLHFSLPAMPSLPPLPIMHKKPVAVAVMSPVVQAVVPPKIVLPPPPPPPPPPKPTPLFLPVPQPIITKKIPMAPVPVFDDYGDLPALRIMPQRPEDIVRHDRPAVVKFAGR